MEKSEVMWICNYTILSFLLIKHVKTMIITNLSGPSLQSRRPSIDKSDLRVHCPIITLPWTALEWIDLDLDLLNFSQREHFKVKQDQKDLLNLPLCKVMNCYINTTLSLNFHCSK